MRDIDNLKLILLNIGLSSLNGDWNWKGISSPFARLYYIKEGEACIHLPQGSFTLKPDHIYLIPPFTLHSYECNSLFTHFYIHIYERPHSSTYFLEEFVFPVEIKADSLDYLLICRLLEINPDRELKQYDPCYYDNPPTLLQNIKEEARQEEYTSLETRGILCQLLSRFLQYSSQKADITDIRISKVLHFIRKNIDQPIRINQLSELCLLSDDHFIRLFKKELNCTPIQYINQKKIEKAQLMLLTENASVKDIAYGLSFENISYFNRLFKQITRYTPTEYCRTLKGK